MKLTMWYWQVIHLQRCSCLCLPLTMMAHFLPTVVAVVAVELEG